MCVGGRGGGSNLLLLRICFAWLVLTVMAWFLILMRNADVGEFAIRAHADGDAGGGGGGASNRNALCDVTPGAPGSAMRSYMRR